MSELRRSVGPRRGRVAGFGLSSLVDIGAIAAPHPALRRAMADRMSDSVFADFIANFGWAQPLFDRTQKGYFMELQEQAEMAAVKVARTQDAYHAALGDLRGKLQNDIASIKAISERIDREFQKLGAGMQFAIETMTSPEMMRAIDNAERIAAALKAINEIESAQLTFAVIDKKQPT